MIRPIRLIITLWWLCHLLVGPAVLTCQTQPAQIAQAEAEPPINSVCLAALPLQEQSTEQSGDVIREPVQPKGMPADIFVDGPTEKNGPVIHLRDNVRINFRGYMLRADDIVYNLDTGEAVATGHVWLQGGPRSENIQATKATYNTKNDTGTLEDVTATLGMAARGGHILLTSPNPLAFTGTEVQRTGPDRFYVRNGLVTTCDLRAPAWSFAAQRIVIDVGGKADLYHATFRLHRVPVLYLPFVQRPVESLGRQSGFLLPSAGQSSTKGTIIGESFYWAINRSMDATIGGEYFSTRGWAQRGEFRMRPEENSFVDVVYSGVLDRGIVVGGQTQKQGGEEVRATADDPKLALGFRGVADIDYLSSYLYRVAFSENFSQAVNSEVKSVAFASRDVNGFSFDVFGSRYQNFESTTPGDLVMILHAPTIESLTSERQLGASRLFWSYSAAAEGVSRSEPGFVTAPLVGRFDLAPSLAMPLLFKDWSVRPEVAVRDTYYSERVLPNATLGVPSDDPLNRRALETVLELRPPALSRVFERPVHDRKLKHTIEPRVIYRYVTGIDNFQNVIRFDSRDILSDTNEVEYAVVNRIYGKRLHSTGNCSASNSTTQNATASPTLTAQGTLAVAQQPTSRPSPEDTVFRPDQGQIQNIPSCEAQGSVRELVRWEVAQKAFFDPNFGGAVVDGTRNVLTTTADFTGIAFLTEPRHFSPIISRLRVQTSANTDLQWNLDYDTLQGRITGSTVFATWRLGEYFLGGNHTFFQAPGQVFGTSPVPGTPEFNQFRILLGYGHPDKPGLTLAGSLGYDTVFNTLQYGTVQTSYNWSCIGLSFEYRRFSLNTSQGPVRVENQYRFALNLANIGTFGNLRRQERLF